MKFSFFRGALLLLASVAFRPATAQRCVWQQSMVGGYGTNVGSMTHDDAGNAYVSGMWRDSLTIGYTHLADPDSGVYNGYIAKLNPAGQVQWVQRTDGVQGNTAMALAADHTGGLYVTGLNPRAFSIGTVRLDSSGVYLARLNAADGTVTWARPLTAPFQTRTFPIEGAYFQSITVDAANNLYLGGYCRGLSMLGTLPLVALPANSSAGLIAKCTPAGVFTDVYQFLTFGSFTGANVEHLQLDPTGGLVVSGGFNGTVQFGTAANAPTRTAVSPPPYRDAFVVRFSAAGATEWVQTAHVLNHTVVDISGMTLDAAGNTYFAGRAYGVISIDGTVAADSGQYVARLSRTGQVDWVKTFPGNERNNFASALTIGADGYLYSTGTFYSTRPPYGPTTYGPSTLFPFGITNLFVMCQDTSGNVLWARTRDRVSGGGSNNLGISIARAPGNRLYVYGYNDAPGTYDGHEVRGYGSFVLRLDPAAFVEGQVYLDQNGDGIHNSNEPGFGRHVGLQESRTGAVFTTGIASLYVAYLDTGHYELGIPYLPRYYRLTQPAPSATHAGDLPTYGTHDTGRDFGLTPVAGQQDLRVSLTPYAAARRGIPLRYRARVENLGTTTTGGLLTVRLDTSAVFINAQPATAPPAAHTLTWPMPALAPNATRDYDISVSLPLNVPLGTPLEFIATVAASTGLDLTPRDNVDTLRQGVIGSFDPNEITVNHSVLTAAQIAAGEPLDYMVYFQNLGSDTAFAVTVHDSLPANLLQLATIDVISQSHNVAWTFDGPGVLTLRFPGIRLPHQAADAVRSQGFVRFRIVPRATLVPGTLIPNRAHITFDYNAPESTNEVTTLVQAPNGLVAAVETPDASMRLYPNPATERVTVSGPVGARLTVLDALGCTVRTAILDAPTVAVSGLAPGVYVVRLALPNGTAASRRLVVAPQ